MHAEYATAWLFGEAELAEPAPPPAPLEELLEEVLCVVLDPRFATPGAFAPPPHPAAHSMIAVSAPATGIDLISSSPPLARCSVRGSSTKRPVTRR
jgi:hypothetical protein